MKLQKTIFFGLLVITLVCLTVTEARNKACRLVTKEKGVFIVCDGRNKVSKAQDKNRSTSSKRQTRRKRKYKLTIKCDDLTTDWTEKSETVEALSKLFAIDCPTNKFLRSMGLNNNGTHIQVKYKCCALE